MTEPHGALPRHHTTTLPTFGTGTGTGADTTAASVASPSADLALAATGTAATPGMPPSPDVPPTAEPVRLGHVAALDGLRALAVVAVLLYHAEIGGVRGGFLGVDVFFVLSGYLITGLLAREFLATGRLDLRRFYVRRARRLLPALFTVIAAVCLLVVARLPGEAAGFRDDAAASATYVTNWWFVFKGQSYFGGTGRPSLVLHLWSLAVEEQFYLLWPVFFVVMIGRTTAHGDRVRALWRAVGWATLFGLCSIGLTVVLYSPWRDPSRVYYGTDTRAFELIAGVILALVQLGRAGKTAATEDDAAPGVGDVGLTGVRIRTMARMTAREGVAFVTLAALLWAFAEVPATSAFLYPQGLLVVSVATALLIRALVSGCVFADVLGRRPMVWLGERSYALYLWHWPVFDVTRPGVDVSWPAAAVFAVRIVVSLVLADLTHRFIEQPVRGGVLGRIAGRCRESLRARRFGLPAVVAGTTLMLGASAISLAGLLGATAAAHPADARAVAVDTGPAAALTVASLPGSLPAQHQPAATFPTIMPAPPAHPPRVAVVGDSQGMTLVLNRPPDTAAYLRLIDDSTEGCGLLGGRITSGSGERRDLDAECGPTLAKWASRAARDRADIALMMIGAWDLFDEHVDGTALPFGTAGWDSYFTTRLGKAVGGLRAAGVPRVDVSLLPCYRPFRSTAGIWPERGDDQRVQHVNALLTAFTKDTANHTEPLYPPPGFCEDPVVSASRSYRWDGVHYYKPGARLFLRTAIPQLLAPTR